MKMSKVPPGYHGVFGIKFLLAMHVFAPTASSRPGVETGRQRQMTGIIISGIAILSFRGRPVSYGRLKAAAGRIGAPLNYGSDAYIALASAALIDLTGRGLSIDW
jgi:hypothetical protein